MKAKIKQIMYPRFSRNGDVFFQRIKLQMEDGSFAMTDLVSTFRNFKWWEPVIKAGTGTVIGGVFLKDGYKDKVNADSQIYIIQETLVKDQIPQLEIFKVSQPDFGSVEVYRVNSFTIPKKKYEITNFYGMPRCSCPDFRYMQRKCKHIKTVEKQKVEERKRQHTLAPKLF